MKADILNKISKIKDACIDEGIIILGVFGSVARGDSTAMSDIDITYEIDYERFFSKYPDGFSQILKLDEIKKRLEKALQRRVDFISFQASKSALKERIKKDLIYV